MALDDTFARTLQHYVRMAQQRGCWAHAQHMVRRMGEGTSGLYAGLHAAWQRELDAIGFQPDASEVFQEEQSEAQRFPWKPVNNYRRR